MEGLVWVVARSDDGVSWAVREAAGGQPLATAQQKDEAVLRAATDLAKCPAGGELRVYCEDGRLERLVDVPPAREAPIAQQATTRPGVADVAKTIDDEGEHIDTGLAILADLSVLIFGSGTSAWISTEVRTAMADGWWALFLATLTWSLGCAVIFFVLTRSKLTGWPLALACLLAFWGSSVIAAGLGTGVLDIETATSGAGNPLEALAGIALAAFVTYGIIGTITGAAVGAWLAWRSSRLFG
jgi:hypothetical protein